MTGSPAIGIDLGGTKIRAALLAEDGSPLHVRHEGTRKDGPPKILIAQLADIIRELQSQCPERAAIPVGIGVAGQIDAASGAITFAPNLSGWREVPLGRLLAEALGRAVFVTNDVRAAAAGEWNFGAGRGCADVVVLFVGTGIGGAVISGGRILTGHRNSAGELGHTTVQLDGPPCHCLNRGCLEALAGGWAIARRARELALASPRDGALL
ncbi:MAG TPA: ROK family protein, partial [candidate division Zixibacteria bacterium]|nr:ROK family protein [candidate division Zixibacteria bacterium]